jgi:hypothetical protein
MAIKRGGATSRRSARYKIRKGLSMKMGQGNAVRNYLTCESKILAQSTTLSG